MTQTPLPGYLVTLRLATRMRSGAGFTTGKHAWIDTHSAELRTLRARCDAFPQHVRCELDVRAR